VIYLPEDVGVAFPIRNLYFTVETGGVSSIFGGDATRSAEKVY
jgi:hypothetical protein